eukprot:1160651-Pelagomonas_calceolata.AAC.4
MEAEKMLPTSIKEKMIPRAGAPCSSFTKKKKLVGTRRATNGAGYYDIVEGSLLRARLMLAREYRRN